MVTTTATGGLSSYTSKHKRQGIHDDPCLKFQISFLVTMGLT